MASAVAMLLRTVPQLDNGTLVVMIVDLLPINRRLKLIIKMSRLTIGKRARFILRFKLSCR